MATRIISLTSVMEIHLTLPATFPASAPAVPARRGAGRPRVHADPAPGEAPTLAQIRWERKRLQSKEAYYRDHLVSREKAKRANDKKAALLASLKARVAELEARAALGEAPESPAPPMGLAN